jgi:hypothetical protein
MPKIIKLAKGAYTASDITVDSSGRVIAASSGSGGAFANGLFPKLAEITGSGTYTANSNANFIGVYASGGGGKGGTGRGPGQPARGGQGGPGGFCYFVCPISQPYAVPYAVGGAAGATTLETNTIIANGGGSGTTNPGPTTPGNQGNAGSATSANATSGADASVFAAGGQPVSESSTRSIAGMPVTIGQGSSGVNEQANNNVGQPGAISIFENI